MGSTFTCPNCGRRGSVKKELSPHAKLRCPGCQSPFSPTLSRMPAPSGPTVEDQIDEYLRSDPLRSSPLYLAPTPLDEPVVSSPPQPSLPHTYVAQPPPMPPPSPLRQPHADKEADCAKVASQTQGIRISLKSIVASAVICVLLIGTGIAIGVYGARKSQRGESQAPEQK